MREVPLDDTAQQSERFHVQGVTVLLEVAWLPVPERWYLSASLATGEPVAVGRQVAARSRLLRADPALLAGDLVVWTSSKQLPDPGRDAWTTGHYSLVWLDPDEAESLPAWR